MIFQAEEMTEAKLIVQRKCEAMLNAKKAVNTLRLLVMPNEDLSWPNMFNMFDEVFETCHEASTRFVKGHSDLVWLPEDQLRESLELSAKLRENVRSMEGDSGSQAVAILFDRLIKALNGDS
jgi:hypothetical protein